MNITSLRRYALIGLAIVLVVDLCLSLRTQGLLLGGATLCVLIIGAGLVSAVLMPGAVRTLQQNRDLLVPLALAIVAGKLVAWLTATPLLGALLSPSVPLRIFNISIAVSASALLQFALAVAYAVWMTGALVELVRTGAGDPCRVMPAAAGKFWRMAGLLFANWVVIMLGSAAVLMLMPAIGFVALLPLLLLAVLWNYATAAVLPVAWMSGNGFWSSFRTGMTASVANAHKWALLLLAQMLLLGLVFVWFSQWDDGGGSHRSFNWGVNAFWTGGYEDSCRWYPKLADAMHTKTLPLVETLLTLLFGALAVAVKLAIVQRLSQEPSPVLASYATT